MDPTILLSIAIPVAIILIALGYFAARQRRSKDLRTRFGPEYDRVVQGQNRREAENQLAMREHRARKLELRSLSPDEQMRLTQSWSAIQRRFVDDPGDSVREAHVLLEEVMRLRGYPTQSFDDEVELLSVDHPDAVQHFRAAFELADQRNGGSGDTEQNRQAMIHYRALFEDLLDVEEDDLRTTTPYAGAPVDTRP
jgi:hypothetical protein